MSTIHELDFPAEAQGFRIDAARTWDVRVDPSRRGCMASTEAHHGWSRGYLASVAWAPLGAAYEVERTFWRGDRGALSRAGNGRITYDLEDTTAVIELDAVWRSGVSHRKVVCLEGGRPLWWCEDTAAALERLHGPRLRVEEAQDALRYLLGLSSAQGAQVTAGGVRRDLTEVLRLAREAGAEVYAVASAYVADHLGTLGAGLLGADAALVAERAALPALEGSDKQIAWASKIRAEALAQLDKWHARALAQLAEEESQDALLRELAREEIPVPPEQLAGWFLARRAELVERTACRFWIDMRHEMELMRSTPGAFYRAMKRILPKK